MTTVFADAFYYFALINPADDRHKGAREFTAKFAGKVVTTAWIMTEVGDGLAKAVNRPLFLEIVSSTPGGSQRADRSAGYRSVRGRPGSLPASA
jgi:hypothetical protein